MNTDIAEINISYSSKHQEEIKITNSHSAYEVLKVSWNMDVIELQEEFKIVLLNRANQVLGIFNCSKGGMSGTVVDLKLVFAVALKCTASAIIVAHNHPSGNLKPSNQDIKLTKKLREAAAFLDIEFLDHIILTRNGYFSFRDESLL